MKGYQNNVFNNDRMKHDLVISIELIQIACCLHDDQIILNLNFQGIDNVALSRQSLMSNGGTRYQEGQYGEMKVV